MPINPSKITKKQIMKYAIIIVLIFAFFFLYLYSYSRLLSGAVLPLGIGGQDESNIGSEIDELNQKLKTRRDEIDELKEEAEKYRQKVIDARQTGLTLKNQIFILDNQIARTRIEIKTIEQEIALTELEIEETIKKINNLIARIKEQKDRISEILRDIAKNDDTSYLEILLMNDSLSDFFNAAKYLENLHTSLHKQLIELKETKDQLDTEKISLEEKKKVLEEQKTDKGNQKNKLETQQSAKNILLDETQNNERKFKSLLADLRAEQASIEGEITSLEKSIRQKLEEQEKERALQYLKGEKLMWPVPKNTITAYFHDPTYPYRYIFEHPAVDIKAKQGTIVKAAASGYVAKSQTDSSCKGKYAYVMIIHADGLSTVYGHLNQTDIEEGQFVVQGQRIGLSGGMPGTCGAGRLTTGPHHHFEVRLNGIPVDPLGYLP